MTEEQRSEGEQETARLMKQESASVYLGSQVLAYATDHPKDPDVPESLYLVLRMIRYDCSRWDATPAQKLEATKIEAREEERVSCDGVMPPRPEVRSVRRMRKMCPSEPALANSAKYGSMQVRPVWASSEPWLLKSPIQGLLELSLLR